jgi:ABC-type lipoprotein export system ATPase subunit
MTLAISAQGLTKRFKTGRSHAVVLRNVDFEAEAGHVTMVMGPSGSGKSTLIAALSGLLRPDEGKVCALGEDLWSRRAGKIDRFRLDHCGFIFQGFNLFPALTAYEQVASVLRYKGLRRKAARERAIEALTEVGLAPRMHSARPNSPAARSSASLSRGRWPRRPAWCSPTSRPRPSTARAARWWCVCCAARRPSTARR